jgi:hypothetical protein
VSQHVEILSHSAGNGIDSIPKRFGLEFHVSQFRMYLQKAMVKTDRALGSQVP